MLGGKSIGLTCELITMPLDCANILCHCHSVGLRICVNGIANQLSAVCLQSPAVQMCYYHHFRVAHSSCTGVLLFMRLLWYGSDWKDSMLIYCTYSSLEKDNFVNFIFYWKENDSTDVRCWRVATGFVFLTACAVSGFCLGFLNLILSLCYHCIVHTIFLFDLFVWKMMFKKFR